MRLICLIALLLVNAASVRSAEVDFTRDVAPILARHCDRCHGSVNQEADLSLSDRHHLESIAGSVDQSLLLSRITDEQAGDLMPLDGQPLGADEVATIRTWIRQGASLPESFGRSGGRHWAYIPPRRTDVPPSPRRGNAIDGFIAERLASLDQTFSPTAKPATLARRVSLALTGLPASSAQVAALEASPDDAGYARLVDQLLASEAFGQHWARHWLDLASYADSNGYQADQIRDSWAYRDWVVDALNADMPFDQFVIDQVAGDLKPGASQADRIATGFYRTPVCNVEAGVHPESNRVQQVFDRVNTTATVFLGSTLQCAQCHDHKYDDFTQADYYRLFAFFNQTPIEVKQTAGVTFDFIGPSMELPIAKRQARDLERAERQLANLNLQQALFQKAELTKAELAGITTRIAAAQKQLDQLRPPSTLVMVQSPETRRTFVMERGDYLSPGEEVTAGTPAALPPMSPGLPRDRMGLAQWLVDADNPLLARVTVNRFWGEVFGRPIVSTPEDFGRQADPPTHPRLLDHLAVRFRDSGWSVKALLRWIVMSTTFRQDSAVSADLLERDPENKFLARGPRFRLSAEAVRDNALAIAGLISTQDAGPPIMPFQPPGIWRAVGRNQPRWTAETDQDRFRRGLYVVWKRGAPYPSFVTFDAPDRASCTVSRPRTNTPLQALVLLNDQAYTEMAVALAQRILAECPSPEISDRIRFGYKMATASEPSDLAIDVLSRLLLAEKQAVASEPSLVTQRTGVLPESARNPSVDQAELAAWYAVASVLLNLDSTITQN